MKNPTVSSPVFADMHHYYLKHQESQKSSLIWTKQNIFPFEELLISWNASRPKQGHYSIYVSVNIENWSPWLLYATWGSDFQKSILSTPDDLPVRTCQDTLEVLEGKTGNGFKIKIIAESGSDLSNLKSLHVCSSIPNFLNISSQAMFIHRSHQLTVNGLSQMALIDERKSRLCSPTSTAAVVRFLKNENNLNPIQFAESVWDSSFDIFGNWVLNVAEAYNQIHHLAISCWVERLASFQKVLDSLQMGFPVIISVQGPLPKSAQSYENGHLLVIIGFDKHTCEVICMDPAFDQNDKSKVRYNFSDLMTAWNRRKNIAYVFRHLAI